MISTFMFASSNKGCTCSVYIFRPSFFPPTGLIKTSNLFGLLKPKKTYGEYCLIT